MTKEEFKAALDKIPGNPEIIFVPPADQGDKEYKLVSIDSWDVGPNGAIAISIDTEEG